MRKIAIILFLGNLFCSVLYGAEERKEIKGHPTPEEMQKAQQSSQQQRPILPPVVPTIPSTVSPTPSLHITAPQIPQQVINQPPQPAPHVVSQPPRIQSIPSTPTYATPPSVPVPVEMPKVPLIGNTIGKVTNIGSSNDGSFWIEVNDELFGTLIKVNIRNLKNTPIVKQAAILNFKDIKIGDTVNAMYHTEEDDNVANFINVLSEEEIEMMKQPAEPELTVSPVEPANPSKEKGITLPEKR